MVYGMMNPNTNLLMEEGGRKAALTGKDVLVSSVFALERADLSAFFSYQDERFCGNRFFWSEPGRELSFAGLGSALVIESDDPDKRYQQVERQWKDVVKSCVTDEDIPEHTGPLIFGGFSFDPRRQSSDVWGNFSHTHFIVPEVMLTEYKGRTWITVNKLTSADGCRENIEEELERVRSLMHARHESGDRRSAGTIAKEEITPQDWMRAVEQAATSIRAGQLDKVVLARHLRLFAEHPFQVEEVIRRLLLEQNNTYVFAIEHGSDCFVGATPERLIRSRGRELQTLSLAGTIARGKSEAEDRRLGDDLFHDAKNLHEHALAVQMIRDEMQKLCENVRMPDAPILHKLKDIQHLLTPIAGQAKPGVTLLKAVEALHPTPALGGMPRDAAMAAIRELENIDRGWYAAPIGWMNRAMDGEFAVAIRSALIQGKEALLFSGCGIVGDSDPVSEYQETALKFRPMLSALEALDADS